MLELESLPFEPSAIAVFAARQLHGPAARHCRFDQKGGVIAAHDAVAVEVIDRGEGPTENLLVNEWLRPPRRDKDWH